MKFYFFAGRAWLRGKKDDRSRSYHIFISYLISKHARLKGAKIKSVLSYVKNAS